MGAQMFPDCPGGRVCAWGSSPGLSQLWDPQIHYEWWRRVLKFFWMAMVCYSMIVLIAIYTYQFRSVAGFFNHTLGLSEEG